MVTEKQRQIHIKQQYFKSLYGFPTSDDIGNLKESKCSLETLLLTSGLNITKQEVKKFQRYQRLDKAKRDLNRFIGDYV